ncbi:MAG: IMP cyclohydrolase [Methanobrevibacter sp.]|jgi:IMP cyclohydrolase|nr:IMP cyclohydrolase [Candidatus Methanovirga basalitermitum]
MYLGRILAVGMSKENKPFLAYRVSSRSFPNRRVKVSREIASIIPKKGYEKDIFENPYISYNCLKIIDNIAVITNGSHTDVIADKINSKMNLKDALTLSLFTMDYEKDDYNTPRIAGVVNPDDYEAYIGIVTNAKILVEKIEYGTSKFISTYEQQTPSQTEFPVETSKDVAEFIFDKGEFKDFTNPVSSVGAIYTDEWTIDSIN